MESNTIVIAVKTVDADKPIIAEHSDGSKYLLLPRLERGQAFTHRGYDWFSLQRNDWNSCRNFVNKTQAIQAYTARFKIYNAEIITKELK